MEFSLLWKDVNNKCDLKLEMQYEALSGDLHLRDIFSVISKEPIVKITPEIFFPNITSNYSDIAYRQNIIKHLMKNSNAKDAIEKLLNELNSLERLNKNLKSDLRLENIIMRIKKLDLFLSICLSLYDLFKNSNNSDYELHSLSEEINKIIKHFDLNNISENLGKVKDQLQQYRSVDIGVNFDSQFCIKEAIALKINDFIYTGGGVIDKLRAKREEIDYMPISKESDISNSPHILFFTNEVYRDLEKHMGEKLDDIEQIVERYSQINTGKLLFLKEELLIIYGALRLCDYLTRNDCPYCYPEKSNQNVIFERFISIPILQKTIINEIRDDLKVVGNTVEIDKKKKAVVITGPNSGGKTVLVQSLASMQILFQLGFPIPAVSAGMKIYDRIFTHFPKDENPGKGTGRLGEEVQRISELIKEKEGKTLLAMNEPFVTTSPDEGLEILILYLRKLCDLGIDIYVVTHYLEILDELEDRQKYLSLVMEMVNGVRSYKVLNQEPMTESFARDIAKKYGIDKESVLRERKIKREDKLWV